MGTRVLVVNPSGEEVLGILGDVMQEACAHVDELAMQEAVDLLVSGPPSPSVRVVPSLPRTSHGHDCLVLLGSPLGVLTSSSDTEDQYPPRLIEQVETLVRDFSKADKPVLGICLGAQLIARTFGGEVSRLPRDPAHTALPRGLVGGEASAEGEEFGWHPQEFMAAAEVDPVVGPALQALRAALPPGGPLGSAPKFAQWHSDTFTIPSGAVQLSTRPTCPAQAFRLGRRTYAFQYHIEVGPELARQWCRDFADGSDSYVEKECWKPVCGEDRAALEDHIEEVIAEGSIVGAEAFTRSLMFSLLKEATDAKQYKTRSVCARAATPIAIAVGAVMAAAMVRTYIGS